MPVLSRLAIVILLCFWMSPVSATVDVLSFDSSVVVNEGEMILAAGSSLDSIITSHPMLARDKPVLREYRRIYYDSSFHFYIVLGLILFFGVMRFGNPRYFEYLLRAFRSPSLSAQQLKDQLGTSVLPNFLMNLFFVTSVGIYLYFVFKLIMPQRYAIYSPSLLIIVLIAGMVILYAGKYVILRFSGWAFNVHAVSNYYMYNVFLINKVIAVALLPFTILIAFAQTEVAIPAMIVSLFLIGLLFINRYMRSWQVLGSFFQYSKFHFFAYLCASEILPMALLTKLLIRGMYY